MGQRNKSVPFLLLRVHRWFLLHTQQCGSPRVDTEWADVDFRLATGTRSSSHYPCFCMAFLEEWKGRRVLRGLQLYIASWREPAVCCCFLIPCGRFREDCGCWGGEQALWKEADLPAPALPWAFSRLRRNMGGLRGKLSKNSHFKWFCLSNSAFPGISAHVPPPACRSPSLSHQCWRKALLPVHIYLCKFWETFHGAQCPGRYSWANV